MTRGLHSSLKMNQLVRESFFLHYKILISERLHFASYCALLCFAFAKKMGVSIEIGGFHLHIGRS